MSRISLGQRLAASALASTGSGPRLLTPSVNTTMTRRLPTRCRALTNSAVAASIPQLMQVPPLVRIASILELIALELVLRVRSIGLVTPSAKLTIPHWSFVKSR